MDPEVAQTTLPTEPRRHGPVGTPSTECPQPSAHSQVPTALRRFFFGAAAAACLFPLVSSPVALLGGFLFTLAWGNPFEAATPTAVNWLLKTSVVGLGFGMNLNQTLAAGRDGLGLTVFTIAFTLAAGFLIGRALGLQRPTSHLIASGTAICGGSAIAAVAPVIRATPKDIAIALGVVFALNSVALLLFPPVGHWLELSQHQFGLWSAIAIHDTSSVVGAALTYGEEALRVATTVKLARALWIIPVAVLSAVLFRTEGRAVKVPWFIAFFVMAVIVNTVAPLPTALTTAITFASKRGLVLTLFLIGAGLSVERIREAGWRPMMLGVSLWVLISVISLGIVRGWM